MSDSPIFVPSLSCYRTTSAHKDWQGQRLLRRYLLEVSDPFITNHALFEGTSFDSDIGDKVRTGVSFLANMAHAGLDCPFRFMDLPAEIRKRVYELLFFGSEEDDGPIQPAHESPRKPYFMPLESFDFSSFLDAEAVPPVSRTASRQIHMYLQAEPIERRSAAKGPPPYRKPVYRTSRRFPLAIFRSNHAIQAESESVFYGSASFNLMNRSQGGLLSWECISELPRRYRRLIRRVEHFCFESISASTERRSRGHYTLLDWTLFLKILGNECPALQSLRLWVHSDQQESEWLAGACENDPWIQAILQLQVLEDLRHFDMPGITPVDLSDSLYSPTDPMAPYFQLMPAHTNYGTWYTAIHSQFPWLKYGNVLRPTKAEPSCNANILPWLKARLLKTKCPIAPTTSHGDSNMSLFAKSFPILKLPPVIRAWIYRHALLPANKQVHPYIKSWYDETTRAVVPLLLICRAVLEEAEQVLYGHGVFTAKEDACTDATGALLRFFKELPSRLRAKIRYVLVDGYNFWITDPIRYLEEEMCLEQLTLLLSPRQVQSLNSRPTRRGNRILRQEWPRVTGKIKNVQLNTQDKDDVDILPEVRKWFEIERPEIWLKMENRRQSLRSARTPSKKIVGK